MLKNETKLIQYSNKSYWIGMVDCSGTIPSLEVRIYKKLKRKYTMFGILSEYRYKEIYYNQSGWNRYSDFKKDYIGLIRETIVKFEEETRLRKEYVAKLKEQEKHLENWDGIIN